MYVCVFALKSSLINDSFQANCFIIDGPSPKFSNSTYSFARWKSSYLSTGCSNVGTSYRNDPSDTDEPFNKNENPFDKNNNSCDKNNNSYDKNNNSYDKNNNSYDTNNSFNKNTYFTNKNTDLFYTNNDSIDKNDDYFNQVSMLKNLFFLHCCYSGKVSV
jgi:hypothetical protein